MNLRPYQQDALNAIKADIDVSGASLVVMPTGSGKSHIIAETALLKSPVLILQPSQELLIQNRGKLTAIIGSERIGTYSASCGEKVIKEFTFATIQSVYKKPEEFSHFKLVIIDEAHQLAPRNLSTMYTSFIKAIGSPKVIGLTATPYRLEVAYMRHNDGTLEAVTMLKLINRMRHKNAKEIFWKKIIYQISHQELLAGGYLVPLEYIHNPLLPYSEIPINKSHSDYNLEAYSQAVVGREANIINTIGEAQKRFKSILVFCATTEQADHLSTVIVGSKTVFGSTNKKEREQTIKDFKSGAVKTVFNMGCLTTGFDHPSLDCIILLRPTRSLPLYNQMLGRLTRPAPDKQKGTVIDLTGTCKAIGAIESFELYQSDRGLWDLKTERHPSWNNRTLFTRIV